MLKTVISYIFGVCAMVALFSIYQQRSRKRMLASKLCADFCWVIHYLCIGAIGGAIPNFVGIFREMIFFNRETKKWASRPFWPIIFIAVNLMLGITTFKSPINILPIAASVFVTISLWLKKPEITKIISFPVSVVFLIYDIFVGSWVGVVNESASLISIIISFVEMGKEHKANKQVQAESNEEEKLVLSGSEN